MALSLTLKDISYEIWTSEIDMDSDFSEASITAWLRQNFAKLGSALNVSLSLNETTLEVSPELTESQKVIFKAMFYSYYLSWKVRKNLGASSIDIIEFVDTMGGKIRRANRNEIAKTFKDERKDNDQLIKDMIAHYKIDNTLPLQVAGSDIYADYQSNLIPSGAIT